nr:hypothetical protein [uncultured Mucilaginibacter sp.]
MKLIRVACILFFLPIPALYAQEQIDTAYVKGARENFLAYKQIFAYADSVNKIQEAGFLDNDIFRITDSLDAYHPAEYYKKVGLLMKVQKLNEAAFLLNVARFRYRYYNHTNPDFKESDDGALSAALYATVGEFIENYLKTNIENYVSILKKASEWYKLHDYKFQPRSKDPAKYLIENNNLDSLIINLEANKKQYQVDWLAEINELKKQIDDGIIEIDKLLKKTKQR